jgi:hypothetical protein
MKSRYFAILIALFYIPVCACKKAPQQSSITGDYFIYGHAGGYTTPDYHTSYFLVNNGKLLKDASQLAQSPPANIELFRFTQLCPVAQYNSVADLPSSIPVELLRHNNAIIGSSMPDAGYSDLRARINGTTYKWVFEANLDSVSQPIREFYNRCNISFR